VDRDEDRVEVLVTEGHVQFERTSLGDSSIFVSTDEQRAFDMFAGQRTFIHFEEDGSQPVIEEISFDQIEDELAWKEKIIEFNGAPLSKVIYELNLRNSIQIRIVDTELRNRRITAAIRPDNVEGFIELLEAALGVSAKQVGKSEIYLQS